MNLSSIVKQDVLAELRKGNTDILKGLPPVLAMQYGRALQNEAGNYIEESQIKDKELNEAMLNQMKDSGVKEMLIKKIKQEKVTS